MDVKAGSTSVTKNVLIYDSSTGLPLTGLAYNTAGLTAYYVLPGAASVSITLATQTATGGWSSGGFVEVDSTYMPGVYRLDIPNAAIASGRTSIVYLQGATNMAPCVFEVNIIGFDNTTAGSFAAGTSVAITGTAQTGTLSTTQCTSTATSSNANQYKGRSIIFTSGTNLGVSSPITASTTGGLLTYTTLPSGVAPSNGDTFIIV